MRIALVAAPWLPVPPKAYGGTEGVIDLLATGFVAAGHEVLLFTTGDSTCPVARAWVRPRSDLDLLGQSVIELHHLIHAYDRVADFDIIHDHTILGPVYAQGRCRGQVVTTNHGPFTPEVNDIYARIGQDAALIAISHDQASRSTVPVSAVIHHGVRPEDFPIGAGDGDHLLFLGRFSPDKGAREAALAAHEAGVTLVMAAKMREPGEIEYFHEQVEPLLDSRVQYVGEVGRRRKLELLGSARALINPIRWPEPFGLAMIEALACGTPVLTLKWGAAPEIVDHGTTGFLCDSDADLVAAIGRVGELDRAQCRRAVEARFSADRMVRDHLDLYERLLDRPRPPITLGPVDLTGTGPQRPGVHVGLRRPPFPPPQP
jgi:glycosyltransferase involved in cell wall biosynthesis